MKSKKQSISLNLTEFDIDLVLIALGALQHDRENKGMKTKTIEFLINKVYRAMGVKL